MNVELTRYRVIKGKSSKVDEWLCFLNEHIDDVLVTLEGEKMYVETPIGSFQMSELLMRMYGDSAEDLYYALWSDVDTLMII